MYFLGKSSTLLLLLALFSVVMEGAEGGIVTAIGGAILGGAGFFSLKKKKKEDDDEVSVDSPDDEPKKKHTPAPTPAPTSKPSSPYGFLYAKVDDKKWCITASNGVRKGAVVELKPCRFEAKDNSQLWKFKDGQFKSAKDKEQCLTVGNDKQYAKIRMAPCEADGMNMFKHEGDMAPIKVKGYHPWCLTNQGGDVEAGDPILVDDCEKSNPKFLFTFKK